MKLKQLAFWTTLLLSISGVQIAVFPGPTIRTVIEFVIFVVISILFLANIYIIKKIIIPYKRLLRMFFIYGLFIFIYSSFVAKNYLQWRHLFADFVPFLLVPWISVLGILPQTFSIIIKLFLKLTIPLSFTFFLFGRMMLNENVFFVVYLSFIYFLIILIPYLKLKWQILIIIVSLISLFFNLDNRSNILSIISSYCFVLSFYFVNSLFLKKILHFSFLLLPIIFSLFSVFNILNVFEYLEKNQSIEIVSMGDKINLTTDSRTSIYKDAFNDLSKNNTWIFGSSATSFYNTSLSNDLGGYDKGRLGGSESGFLNFLQYGGLIYVVLAFLLFWRSSYLAIYKSRNSIIKLVGLFISFRWLFLFIENPISLNFYWFSLFLAMGMCFSTMFRKLSDKEMIVYFSKF